MRSLAILIKSVAITVFFLLLFVCGSIVGAQADTTYKVGDQIQFGSYPQTEVRETTSLKNAAKLATWKSYDYYPNSPKNLLYDESIVPSDFMRFADFYCEGIKYRAVVFNQYRPDVPLTSVLYPKQEKNGYKTNKVYYFQYEPLIWRVLDTTTGLILCENVIDSQAYNNTKYKINDDYWRDKTQTVYANDYAASSIRNWLNYDFYETAFSENQKANILKKNLNNNAYYSTYNSATTNDKIFLLSLWESLCSGYYKSANKGTDYSCCQGLHCSTDGVYWQKPYWLLRTAGKDSGSVCYYNEYGRLGYDGDVSWTAQGIRPACCLVNISSDTFQSDYLFSSGMQEHIPGEALTENEVPATCKAKGSYDEVVYCTECGVVLSRSSHEIDMLAHTPGEIVVENEIAATCKAKGSYDEAVYCTECGAELNRAQRETDMIEHTPGEAVIENEKVATCSERGKYDRVIYCSVCEDELNRETVEMDVLGHTTVIVNAKEATATESGYTGDVVCTVCGETIKAGEVIPPTAQPDEPGQSEKPTSGRCPFCGRDHSGSFFQKIIAFFHRIFALLFGARY